MLERSFLLLSCSSLICLIISLRFSSLLPRTPRPFPACSFSSSLSSDYRYSSYYTTAVLSFVISSGRKTISSEVSG